MPAGNPTRRRVDLADRTYQPSKRELEQDLRVPQGFEATIQALVQTVEIKHVRKPKS